MSPARLPLARRTPANQAVVGYQGSDSAVFFHLLLPLVVAGAVGAYLWSTSKFGQKYDRLHDKGVEKIRKNIFG